MFTIDSVYGNDPTGKYPDNADEIVTALNAYIDQHPELDNEYIWEQFCFNEIPDIPTAIYTN